MQNSMVDEAPYVPRSERVSFDLLARCVHAGHRTTIVLRNLSLSGACIEGSTQLRWHDPIRLLLPSLRAKEARVAWVSDKGAGIEFDRPLHPDIFENLVLHHAQWRLRNDLDRPSISLPSEPFPLVALNRAA